MLKKLYIAIVAFFSVKVAAAKLCASIQMELDASKESCAKLSRDNDFFVEKYQETKNSLDAAKREASQLEAKLEIAELQNKALVLAHTDLSERIKTSIAIRTARRMEATRPQEEI